MTRNNTWRFVIIVLVVAWSLYEFYPPTGTDLNTMFRTRAVKQDAAFTEILARLDTLQQTNSERQFANVLEAAGTNDLAKYFPFYGAQNELNPNRYVLNRLQRDGAGKIKLGLDLQGGTSFLVGVDLAKATTNVDTNEVATGTNASPVDMTERNARVLTQAIEVLRKRVDPLGVAEPLLQPAGNDQILIQLPGLSEEDKEAAKISIQKPAYLEFRMVHEKSRELLAEGMTEPGYVVLKKKVTSPDGHDSIESYLVKRNPERGLTGKYIKSAGVIRNPVNNQPEIDFALTSKGADLFADVTRNNIGRQLAIVLDGELVSAPVIQGEIPGGRGQITGNFSDKEAFELATDLENPLEAPVKILESREVDPSLGKDSINSGIRAALYGTLAVAGFMLVYYMFAGLIADMALMLNIVILLGVMCSIGTTLTLPGIAGVVLTIGMAVDANVLIFERIREELAASKSLRGAVSAGYAKAFGTIFDSHVTTLISSVILIFMGTGPVKGFGMTLTIGVAASLFTALVVTRVIFDFVLARNWIKSLPMLHIIRDMKLDFMKLAIPAFTVSWLIILIGLGYGLHRGKGMLGVDFAGGDQQTYSFTEKVDVDKLREELKSIGFGDASIQYQKDISNGKENLRITTAFDTADKVTAALKEKFTTAGIDRKGLDKVGPTVGAEITKAAIVASLLSLFGILIYVAVRYEFSFAVGAVIAVLHDVLMTIGCYCLSGREFNATMVAAVLTIIGFSINDTIVIFDRIREDLKLGVRGTFREVINKALNQTLSRTIITSGTVFLATGSLYLFGGGVINDFAFTFLVGIITGTYSSIYIASALVLWWHRGDRPKTGSQVVLQNATTAKM